MQMSLPMRLFQQSIVVAASGFSVTVRARSCKEQRQSGAEREVTRFVRTSGMARGCSDAWLCSSIF
jgi:hypothetical protein